MSRDADHDATPIESFEQLRTAFEAGAKGPDAQLGVGTEHEKFGFDAQTLAPLPYEGAGGIGALLAGLADRFGWHPVEDAGHVVALERDGGAITLEPGGQFELSGRVTRTVQETRDELNTHLREVAELGAELGQRWSFMALNPWDTLDDVPWMPKSRYRVMRDYLPSRGALAHWMMKMTCTVQANFDYRDEADAFDIIRTCAAISPITTALFANSPIRRGQLSGWASTRMMIWEQTDPDRTGIPGFFLDEGATFDDWVTYMLDVPMFFVRRGTAYVNVAGTPFRQFLDEGVEGTPATLGDWELHLSSAFPDVRLKRYIELRNGDASMPAWLLAFPALYRGLLYDADARDAARSLLPLDGVAELRGIARESAERGLDAHHRGDTLRDYAGELVRIAAAGLSRLAADDGTDDSGFLDVLTDDAGVARAPGELFAEAWDEVDGDRAAILDRFGLAAGLAQLKD